MGAQAQQQPVYYDTESNQYFTNNTQNKGNNIFETMFGNMGMLTKDNPFYVKQMASRNYLGNPYGSANPDRFIPKNIPAQYPDMDMLFPALNTGLLDSLFQGSQPDGAMYGAGKYLTGTNLLSMPTTTTSESKGK